MELVNAGEEDPDVGDAEARVPLRELRSLRHDVLAEIDDDATRVAVAARFDAARFPFRHDRLVPRITVAGTVGEVSLEPGFRKPRPWTIEAKKGLIQAGYDLTDAELLPHNV